MHELVEDFIQYLRNERGQSENTQKTYFALLNQFVIWAVQDGVSGWEDVQLNHLMRFLQHERERSLANQPKESTRRLSSESVYLEIAALRAFYRWAENEKLLAANAAENLSLPRRWRRLPKALTNDEISRLLAPLIPETPASLCDQAILELAYACGLRISEMLHLQVTDIDSARMVVNVRQGKGAKDRQVPLSARLLSELRQWWCRHRTKPWLFPGMTEGSRHKPMNVTNVQRMVKQIVVRAKLKKPASMHTLRHSYATHLLEAGVPVALIQEYLGHSSPSTTAIYTHVTRELRATALDPINDLIPRD